MADLNELAAALGVPPPGDIGPPPPPPELPGVMGDFGAQLPGFMDKYGTRISGNEGIGLAVLSELARRDPSGSATMAADKAVQEILDEIRAEATMVLDSIKQQASQVADLTDQINTVQEAVAAATGSGAPGDGAVNMPDIPPPPMPDAMPEAPVDMGAMPPPPPDAGAVPPAPEGAVPPAPEQAAGEPAPTEPPVMPSDKRVKLVRKPALTVPSDQRVKTWKPPASIVNAIYNQRGGI